MRLILIRHPQPLVAPGVCYGSSDLPAEPKDLERVLAELRTSASIGSGKAHAPLIPDDTPLYASPLLRCAALAHRLGTPVLDARLAEMDFGAWELRSWDDIPRAEVDAWAADLVHYRPGGGENVLLVAARVAAFRAELLRQPHAQAAIICHAGTIRLLTALQAGLPLHETALLAAASPHKTAYGEAVILEASA
ncbi:histidine phosphatase family protein [Pseudoduganella sp. LjRoot289]|uniref:histidine phosphatase family protein n=1 Tax=Pseudoduganella sp. LjRoot289 TaxID=3342314 RepID=UPI003ECDDDDA